MKLVSTHPKLQRQRQSNISALRRLIIYLLTITMILITMMANLFWKESLYQQGLYMIRTTQTNLDFEILKIINNLFSLFGNPLVVSIILVVQLCVVKHKFKALIHISFLLLGLHIIAFFKLAYQQSRPIWTWNQIHKWEWFCPKDFGNPSGHSFIIFPLYQPIISKYIGFQNFKSAWVLLILFGFLVPFSRTYLGMHSVNQVAFGLALGVGATVMYRYALKQWFYVTYSKIFKLKKVKYLLTAIMCHLVCLTLPFLFFQLYSDNRPIEQKDLLNLNRLCSLVGAQDDITSAIIQEDMLVKCTFQSFIFGIIYGLYFLNLTNRDIRRQKLYFAGRWSYYSKKAAFQHTSTIILLCAIIAMIFVFFIPHFIETTSIHYFSYTAGSTLMGFTLIFFIPKIQRLFVWIDFSQQQAMQLVIQAIQSTKEERDDLSQYFG